MLILTNIKDSGKTGRGIKKAPILAGLKILVKSKRILTLTSFELGVLFINDVNTAFATDDLAVLITYFFAFQ